MDIGILNNLHESYDHFLCIIKKDDASLSGLTYLAAYKCFI